MDKILKQNYNNQNLYCIYCKEKIHIGQRFVTVFEELYNGEEIEKTYHCYCPFEENEE